MAYLQNEKKPTANLNPHGSVTDMAFKLKNKALILPCDAQMTEGKLLAKFDDPVGKRLDELGQAQQPALALVICQW
jgi:hypothetical protein